MSVITSSQNGYSVGESDRLGTKRQDMTKAAESALLLSDEPRLIHENSASSAASTGSTTSSSSTLMDDVMARLESKQEDPAQLIRRINSLLGLNDEVTSSQSPATAARTREHSPPPTVSVTELPRAALIPIDSSMTSAGSSLKCGWLACWSADDAY